MKVDRLIGWWEERKPRERLLVSMLVVAALAVPFYALVLKPVQAQTADSRRRLESARSELAKLQKVVEERDRTGAEQLRAREADLQARLTSAESEIRQAQIDLIAPQEMPRQLSAILEKFPELHVVGMVTQPPTAVDQNLSHDSKAPPSAEARRSMLFEHGLELTVEGRYLDLIGYLQTLERTPHRIYWRELDMKVNPQGLPVTRIRFFTLSRGPAWLSL